MGKDEIFRKVLGKIREFCEKLSWNYIDRYDYCLNCNKKLTGSQRKFCSAECGKLYWNKTHLKKTYSKLKSNGRL